MVSDFDDAKFNRVLCRILNENHLGKESYQISKEVSKSTGDSWHTDQVALHDAIKSTSSKITRLINNLPSSDIQEDDIEVIAKYIQ